MDIYTDFVQSVYISCENNQYLNINGTRLSVTNNPQNLTVTLKNNKITISSNNFAVNQYDWKASSGFGGYTIGGGDNEKFSLYQVDTKAYAATFSGTHQNSGNNSASNVSYYGSEDRKIPVYKNGENKYIVTLPDDIKVPSNYKGPDGTSNGWKLGGWYVVTNGTTDKRYYGPNETVEITGDTTFYADWVPVNYDYGQNTSALGGLMQEGNETGKIPNLSGSVITEVYDFSSLFNVNDNTIQSEYRDGTTWKIGNNNYGYLFFDDNSNYVGSFDNPSGRAGRNKWTGGADVYEGILNQKLWGSQNLTDTLFNKNSNLMGVNYVGNGDGLFYINSDGYYEYDSQYHAASYNQTEQ